VIGPRSSGSAACRRWTTSACWSATSARPASGSARGGSVVELHAYAAPAGTDPGALRARLAEVYPEAAGARVLGEHVQWRADCPQFAPGSHAHRPGVATPSPGLVLAGDGIRIDLPVALMERAATTGFAAANTLLARWGLAGHALHTVPTHGRMPVLRRLAGSRKERV
jgi:isorenieratene synthase